MLVNLPAASISTFSQRNSGLSLPFKIEFYIFHFNIPTVKISYITTPKLHLSLSNDKNSELFNILASFEYLDVHTVNEAN